MSNGVFPVAGHASHQQLVVAPVSIAPPGDKKCFWGVPQFAPVVFEASETGALASEYRMVTGAAHSKKPRIVNGEPPHVDGAGQAYPQDEQRQGPHDAEAQRQVRQGMVEDRPGDDLEHAHDDGGAPLGQQPVPAWAMYDPEWCVDDEVTIGVQVNGKRRADVTLAKDASEEDARAAALGLDTVARHVGGKEVARFVYVPGKIVNIVVK